MKYVIYFQPRSGSTHLATRLNYPESGYINGFEILSRNTALQLSLAKQKELKDFPASLKREIMGRFFDLHEGKQSVGFKVAPYQIRDDLPGFFQESQRHCDKMVFLYRANFVRVAISQMWSLERNRQRLAARLVKGEEDTVFKMHIEEAVFDYYLKDSILERDTILALSRLQEDKLVIAYEELYENSDQGEETVFDYLEIDKGTALPSSELVKIHSDDLRDHIVNFDEVARWIRRYGCDESFLMSTPASRKSEFIKRGLHPKVSDDNLSGKGSHATSSVRTAPSRLVTRRPIAKSVEGNCEILALVERATIAETYSTSLLKDLKRAQDAIVVLTKARSEDLKAAKQHAVALAHQAARAEAYCQDLLKEQVKLKHGLESEQGMRRKEQEAVQAQSSMAIERAERAENYHQTLLEELAKLRSALEAEQNWRRNERTEAQSQLAELAKRAERAEESQKMLLEDQRREVDRHLKTNK